MQNQAIQHLTVHIVQLMALHTHVRLSCKIRNLFLYFYRHATFYKFIIHQMSTYLYLLISTLIYLQLAFSLFKFLIFKTFFFDISVFWLMFCFKILLYFHFQNISPHLLLSFSKQYINLQKMSLQMIRMDQKSLNNGFIFSSDFWSLSFLTLLAKWLGLLSLRAHLTFLASHARNYSLTFLPLALHSWVHSLFSLFSILLWLRFGLFVAHFFMIFEKIMNQMVKFSI